MKIKISSWNINGIRACSKKGLDSWIAEKAGDIICFQETKANEDQIEKEIPIYINHPKYYTFYSSAEKKGYSGVAIFSSKNLPKPKIRNGFGIEEFDSEGRTLIAEYPKFILICAYFPNGGRDLKRVPYKLNYSKEMAKFIKILRKKSLKPVILAGDYNTAHNEIDLANPKANQKTTGFLPEERAWMDDFNKEGMKDVIRSLFPEQEGLYTWWTYRNNCRERNIGWRIDYFFINEESFSLIKEAYHCPEVLGSDHCPVSLIMET